MLWGEPWGEPWGGLTVTITSGTESPTEGYALTGNVSGVSSLDELAYRVNGDPEVSQPPAVGVFVFPVTLREGANTVSVRAKRGSTEAVATVLVTVPVTFRGLAEPDDLIRLLPRSIAEII